MRDLRTIDVAGAPADTKPDAAKSAAPPAPAAARSAPHGWVLIGAPLLGYALAIILLGAAIFAALAAARGTPYAVPLMGAVLSLRSGTFGYPFYMGIMALIYAGVLFTTWAILPKKGAAALTSYFRRVSGTTMGFAVFTGLFLAFALVVAQSEILIHHIATFHATKSETAIVPMSLKDVAPGLVVVALVGPIVEEVYFRGLLLRWLGSKTNVVFAVLVSAAVFAATHAKFVSHNEIEGLILTGELAVLGLATAVWALATRSLWPSFAVHGSYNAAVIMLPLAATWLKIG